MTDRTVSVVSDNPGRALRFVMRMIKKDLRGKEKAVLRATRKAAKRGAKIVKRRVPVAFSELADSVVDIPAINGAIIIATAPHAAAVENGSRPHTPPLEPLIKWVRLRGMQGLAGAAKRAETRLRKGGSVSISDINSAQHASVIAGRLRSMGVHRGNYKIAIGQHTTTNAFDKATIKIARAIQASIAKHGTKPNAYMLNSLPAIEAILAEEIEAAMSDKGGTDVSGTSSFGTAAVSSAA